MIVAVCCWYDEDPAMLQHCVSSWGGLCDVVVAVDGAFSEFPGGRSSSPDDQREAILRGAQDGGMRALIYRPGRMVSQVEKRSLAFRIADNVASWGDWLLVVDSDEEVDADVEAAKRALAGTALAVAEVEAELEGGVPVPQRRLIRAGLDVRCERLHYRYVTRNGTVLWGEPYEQQVTAVPVPVRLRHRRDLRSPERQARSAVYYERRVER